MTTLDIPKSYQTSRLVDADSWRQARQTGGSMGNYSGNDGHAGPLSGLKENLGEVLASAGHRDTSSSASDENEADDNTESTNDTNPRRRSDADPVKQGVYAYGGRLFHARSGTDPVVSDMGSA